MITTLAFINAINDWFHRVWFKPGNSNLAPDVDSLFIFILWVCIISFLLLMVPMTWWAWIYRRRPGIAQQRTPNHNTALEVTWIVVPLIVVTVIFFWGFWGYMNAQVARGGSEEIVINAKKWAWAATYENGASSPESAYLDWVDEGNDTIRRGNIQFPIIVVPAGRPIKFRMSSQDVIHSFYIPDMRVKMDVFPNRYTSLTFTPESNVGPKGSGTSRDVQMESTSNGWMLVEDLGPDGKPKPGPDGRPLMKSVKNRDIKYRDHFVFCAEYCGTFHSEMAAILRVVDPADYDWVKNDWGNVDNKLSPEDLGQLVWQANGCNACHSIDGSAGTGPSWKGNYGKTVEFSNGGSLSMQMYNAADMDDAWANYIAESIRYPAKHLHMGFANQMPVYTAEQLSQKRVEGVIAFIRKLNGVTMKPKPGAEAPAPAAKPGA